MQKDIARLNKSNFQLAAARARVDRATAAYGISRAGLRPDVDVAAETGRTLTREDGDSDRETPISFGGALNWEPDIWGRLRARAESSRLKLEEQTSLSKQTRLDAQTLL